MIQNYWDQGRDDKIKLTKLELACQLPDNAYPAIIEFYRFDALPGDKPMWQSLSYDLAFVGIPRTHAFMRLRLHLATGQEVVIPPWPV